MTVVVEVVVMVVVVVVAVVIVVVVVAVVMVMAVVVAVVIVVVEVKSPRKRLFGAGFSSFFGGFFFRGKGVRGGGMIEEDIGYGR